MHADLVRELRDIAGKDTYPPSHVMDGLLLKAAAVIEELTEAVDEGAYDFPRYGLHTQRKALVDLIAFLHTEIGPRYELERLFDELRFPEQKLPLNPVAAKDDDRE